MAAIASQQALAAKTSVAGAKLNLKNKAARKTVKAFSARAQAVATKAVRHAADPPPRHLSPERNAPRPPRSRTSSPGRSPGLAAREARSRLRPRRPRRGRDARARGARTETSHARSKNSSSRTQPSWRRAYPMPPDPRSRRGRPRPRSKRDAIARVGRAGRASRDRQPAPASPRERATRPRVGSPPSGSTLREPSERHVTKKARGVRPARRPTPKARVRPRLLRTRIFFCFFPPPRPPPRASSFIPMTDAFDLLSPPPSLTPSHARRAPSSRRASSPARRTRRCSTTPGSTGTPSRR